MTMKLNVGMSRNSPEGPFGSRNASVNLEVELANCLVSEPAKLQEEIRQLFQLVRTALKEELNANNHHTQPHHSNYEIPERPVLSVAGGTRANGSRLATPAQVKALHAITRQQGLDLRNLLRERFRVERPDALTLPQASQLIDALKSTDDPPPAA